jgi:hypothetical protein
MARPQSGAHPQSSRADNSRPARSVRREKARKFMAIGPRRARIVSIERLRVRPRLRACHRFRVRPRLRVCQRLRVTRLRAKKIETLRRRCTETTRPMCAIFRSDDHTTGACKLCQFRGSNCKTIFSTCPNFHRLRARRRLRVTSVSASSSVFCVPNKTARSISFKFGRALGNVDAHQHS